MLRRLGIVIYMASCLVAIIAVGFGAMVAYTPARTEVEMTDADRRRHPECESVAKPFLPKPEHCAQYRPAPASFSWLLFGVGSVLALCVLVVGRVLLYILAGE